MGCAQSTPAAEVEASAPKVETKPSEVSVDMSELSHGASTVELFDAVFKVAEPLIRQGVCKALIMKEWNPNLGLRINEQTATISDYDSRNLPLLPFKVKPGKIHLLTFAELEATKGEWKNFKWPEDLKALWDSDGFIAADLIELEIELRFKPGVELYFGGDNASIELGSDKDSKKTNKEASIRINVPKLRAWWSSKYMELSLAFMQPPEVKLNLSGNLDLFGHDVVNKELEDGGWIDSLIEHVISGFGPHAAKKDFPGNMGKLFGWTTKTFLSEFGNGRPFVIDLSGTGRADGGNS